MPETTAFKYTLKELTELMVKEEGIKKGHWMLQATFSWAVANVLSTEDGPKGPGAMSILTNVGIQEIPEPGPFSIDAAALWKKTPARRKPRKAKKA